MDEPSIGEATEIRDRAFLAVLARLELDAKESRVVHPRGEELRARLPAGDLRRLLLDELQPPLPEEAEDIAAAYWLRRHRGRTRSSRPMPGVPPLWQRVIALDGRRFEALGHILGERIIAEAAAWRSRSDLVTWLAPLGIQGARAVTDRIDPRSTSLPRSTRLSAAFEALCSGLTPPGEIAATLGLQVLATLKSLLATEVGEAVQRYAPATLLRALSAAPPLIGIDAGDLRPTARLLDDALNEAEETPEDGF